MKIKIVVILLTTFGLCADCSKKNLELKQPVLVVVMADDMGWGAVGFNNPKVKSTPNLDKLARETIELDRFYVHPECTPTRVAFQTGRYPSRFGMSKKTIHGSFPYGLPIGARTIAEDLKGVGYRTVIIGKWHLGHAKKEFLPLQRGYDYHYGHYCGTIDYFKHTYLGGLDWHRNESPVREQGYTTDLLTDEAVRLIEKHDFVNTPLFLYLPYNAPHSPIQFLDEDYDQTAQGTEKFRRFQALIRALDRGVGRVVAALKTAGVWDETFFVFTSDNGASRWQKQPGNKPLRGIKGLLFDGGIRVPTLISLPKKYRSRVVDDARFEVFQVEDLSVTLLKLGGVGKGLENKDGIDMLPVLTGQAPNRKTRFLHVNPSGVNGAAVVLKGYKYIENWKGKKLLFPLGRGVSNETKSLAKQFPSIVNEAANLVAKQRSLLPHFLIKINKKKPPEFEVPKVWSPKHYSKKNFGHQ